MKEKRFRLKYVILEWKPEHNEYNYYGWTHNKSVMKSFIAQRKKNLYKVIKITEENESRAMSYVEENGDYKKMLEMLKLQSAYTGETFVLFMTEDEMKNLEQDIQDYFIDLCTLKRTPDPMGCFNVFSHLDQRYIDALDIIGFRPPECDALYPPNEARTPGDVKNIIRDQLSEAYDREYSGLSFREEQEYYYDQPLGLSTLQDPSDKIKYSIESFVKVMKDVLI